MNQAKINTFFSTLNIVIAIAGYQFATIIFSPFMTESEASRIVTIPFRAFSLIISITTIFLNYRSKFKLNSALQLLLLYWILIIFRFFIDIFFRIDSNIKELEINNILIYVFVFTFIPVYSIFKSYKYIDFNKLFRWTFVIILISLLISYYSSEFDSSELKQFNANVALNTIETGYLGLSLLLMVLYIYIYRNNSLLIKAILSIIVIFSLIFMFISGSRAPIFALLSVLFLWYVSKSRYILLSVFILTLIIVIGNFYIDNIFKIIESISPILESRLNRSSDQQFETRSPFYNYAWNAFLDSPIIGKQFAIYWGDGQMSYSHNFILDSLMQVGIIGTSVLLILLYKIIRLALFLLKKNVSYNWVAMLLLMHLISIMFSNTFYTSPIVSILIVLLFMPLDRDNYSLQRLQK